MVSSFRPNWMVAVEFIWCCFTKIKLSIITMFYYIDTPRKHDPVFLKISVELLLCAGLPDLEADPKAVEQSALLRDHYLYYLQCAYEEGCLSSTATALYGTPSEYTLTTVKFVKRAVITTPTSDLDG